MNHMGWKQNNFYYDEKGWMNHQMTKFKIEPGPNQKIISYDVWYDGVVYSIDRVVR